MGLFDLLSGKQQLGGSGGSVWNSLSSGLDDNRQMMRMGGLASIMGADPNQVLQSAMLGSGMDDKRRVRTQEEAQRNQSVDYLMQKGMPQAEAELVVRNGGFYDALKERQAQALTNQTNNKTINWLMNNRGMSRQDADALVSSGQAAEYLKPQKAQERRIIKGPNGRSYYEDGTDVLPKVATAPELTNDQKNFNFAQQNPEFAEYQLKNKRAGAMQVNFNNEQANAAGFADRMTNSEQILRQYEDMGTSKTNRIISSIPGNPGWMVDEDYKKFEQAKRDFATALLRKESGAVIGADEFASVDLQYFPQPGDTPAVIAQKRRNREIAIQGVMRAAGPNYQSQQGNSQTPQSQGVVDYSEYFK